MYKSYKNAQIINFYCKYLTNFENRIKVLESPPLIYFITLELT